MSVGIAAPAGQSFVCIDHARVVAGSIDFSDVAGADMAGDAEIVVRMCADPGSVAAIVGANVTVAGTTGAGQIQAVVRRFVASVGTYRSPGARVPSSYASAS